MINLSEIQLIRKIKSQKNLKESQKIAQEFCKIKFNKIIKKLYFF